jgi:hypothetical protein
MLIFEIETQPGPGRSRGERQRGLRRAEQRFGHLVAGAGLGGGLGLTVSLLHQKQDIICDDMSTYEQYKYQDRSSDSRGLCRRGLVMVTLTNNQ